MKRYKNLVIDANNLFHRNHEKLDDMTHVVGQATIVTGGIYGSLRSVWKLEREYLEQSEDARVYVLFDNAKSKENMRKSVDPSYKLNRQSMPKTFYRAIDFFRYILLNSSNIYTIVYGTGYEADDIAPLILSHVDNRRPSLVVSEDLDWARLIGWDKTDVDHYMKNQVYDKVAFNKKYNFEPSRNRITLYKTIRGDSVDNIPIGVKGIQEKTVLKLIEDYGDIYDLLDDLHRISYLSTNMRQKFRDNAARLKLNYQLVSFIPLERGDIENHMHTGQYNPRILSLVYQSLGFDIDTFDSRVADYLRMQSHTKDDGFFRQPRFN